jgi:Protein of unknown function (DUF2867)
MRLPTAVLESRPWRIREIAPDFRVEDVWLLPAAGGLADFDRFVDLVTAGDLPDSPLFRALWWARDQLGRFGLGRISVPADHEESAARAALPIPGTNETSLTERLPLDLRDTASTVRFDGVPMVPLYRTKVEFAAELSNQTVHSVMHLGWAEQADGRYRGEMAVYVKPRGLFGSAYMGFIKPFRYLIVYPALMRHIGREWTARSGQSVRTAA